MIWSSACSLSRPWAITSGHPHPTQSGYGLCATNDRFLASYLPTNYLLNLTYSDVRAEAAKIFISASLISEAKLRTHS